MADSREESGREFMAAVMGPLEEVVVPPVRPIATGAAPEGNPSGLSAPGVHAMQWELDRIRQNLAGDVIDGEVIAVDDENPPALPGQS
ncbi:hypothetical protein ACM0AZ_24940 [Mycobacteroides abscessus subsp. massiliense]|uniref:hypothetical protein n=1 Tax=Mycobacteroides abscessus TaxID=36809 RepID=UPI0019CF8ABD|nr:hypothetical protein [Mycobacteroides abscessus]MBN7567081.1 hypothetical protein [Mycobacteroides abscessus subsp. massiliense]